MKKQTLKKCIWIVLEVMFAVILVFNVTAALLSNIDPRTRLDRLPFAALIVQGGSMSPEMGNGDLIVVHKKAYEDLQVGDDVTFFTEDGLVTHRIVDMQDGEFITKGLANEIDDTTTMGADVYCGKVIADIPLLGYAVQLLSRSYAAMVLCLLALFALCFSCPIYRKLKEIEEGGRREENSSMPRRLLACACAMSILFSVPYMTDTKYIGQVNRFEMAVAQPLYFTSNYLDEGNGNRYNILGWHGKEYPINLQIRNYDNELLYNTTNVDVRYGIGTKIYTDNGCSDNYDLVIDAPDDATTLADFKYPQEWTDSGVITRGAYSIAGGSKTSHNFSIKVIPKDNNGNVVKDEEGKVISSLPANTKIHFELYAATEQGQDYAISLLGAFELTVAESTQFIGHKETTIRDSMVFLNIKTNLISDGGADEKIVLFSWDPQYQYLNEYESTAFNAIAANRSCFDKENGYLWMKVKAFSNINLEFFKHDTIYDPDADGNPNPIPDSVYAIDVYVVESIGSTTPLETADPTPTPDPEDNTETEAPES